MVSKFNELNIIYKPEDSHKFNGYLQNARPFFVTGKP